MVITKVDPDGIASEHGLKSGDVILEVGGSKVATAADMRKALGEAQKNGKHAVLMRVKSDNTTKFVAVPFAGAYRRTHTALHTESEGRLASLN